jgi:hypothetical protein
MRINTFGEFYFFITSNNLQELHPEITLFCSCVNQYNTLCQCKRNEKINKGNECNLKYISIVMNILPALKGALFSKSPEFSIEFYHTQSFLINVITR